MTRKGRRIAAALVLGGLILATGWGLWMIRSVLAPFLFAVVITYLLAPLVNALTQRGLSRGWAIVVVYALIACIGVLTVARIVPQLVQEIRRLVEAIPLYALRVREVVDAMQQRVRDLGAPQEMRSILDRNITEMEGASIKTLQALLSAQFLQQAAGFLLSLLLAPILAGYLLKDLERFKERFVHSLPRRFRAEILALLRSLDTVLGGYVRGQLLLGVIVGSMAALATGLLKLRYAILFGIWAGLTECIPYIGPILGAVPAVLAALTISPLLAVEVALAFAVIQQVENAVLSPKIMGDCVGLHPLSVMMTILAGGFLFGAWGLILALPIAGIAKVLWCFLIARLTEGTSS